jgi:hypothetical protein
MISWILSDLLLSMTTLHDTLQEQDPPADSKTKCIFLLSHRSIFPLSVCRLRPGLQCGSRRFFSESRQLSAPLSVRIPTYQHASSTSSPQRYYYGALESSRSTLYVLCHLLACHVDMLCHDHDMNMSRPEP